MRKGFPAFLAQGSEEAVPGPSVFPSREHGVSGDLWGSQEGCQGAPPGKTCMTLGTGKYGFLNKRETKIPPDVKGTVLAEP